MLNPSTGEAMVPTGPLRGDFQVDAPAAALAHHTPHARRPAVLGRLHFG